MSRKAVLAVLVLNADFRPSVIIRSRSGRGRTRSRRCFLDRVNIVEHYDRAVHSPSFEIQLPTVVSLKSFVKPTTHPAFTRFHVFLRDRFVCQYCLAHDDLTSTHHTEQRRPDHWENVVAACSPCNLRKGNLTPQQARMFPSSTPSAADGAPAARQRPAVPANYLHDSWLDYLYWDTELDSVAGVLAAVALHIRVSFTT